MLALGYRRIAIFGARTVFCWRASYFLRRRQNRFFQRRFDRCPCLDRSRCSKTIEFCSMFALGNRRIAIFGARAMFCWRASHFLPRRRNRVFNAEFIDVDASTDRGAQNRSKIMQSKMLNTYFIYYFIKFFMLYFIPQTEMIPIAKRKFWHIGSILQSRNFARCPAGSLSSDDGHGRPHAASLVLSY